MKRSSEEEEEDEEILAEPPPTPKPAEQKDEEQAGDIDSTSPDTPNYELGEFVGCDLWTLSMVAVVICVRGLGL